MRHVSPIRYVWRTERFVCTLAVGDWTIFICAMLCDSTDDDYYYYYFGRAAFLSLRPRSVPQRPPPPLHRRSPADSRDDSLPRRIY